MRKVDLKKVLGSLTILFLVTSVILIPAISMGQETQKGDIVYVTVYHMFYTVGGDPVTHMAGQGPFLATTVFDGLIDIGVDLSNQPSVAKSWQIAPDWTYIDFDLKEGIKFHNGDTLTGEDVKYSMEKTMEKQYRHILGNDYRKRIKDIEVINPYKVRFHLLQPAPGLWKRLWWSGPMMPKKYREEVGDAGFADKPIGSGPYRWTDYQQDQYFKMEAIPKHHRKTSEIKTLKFVYVKEHSTRLAMLKSGEADIIELAGFHIPILKADPVNRLKQVKYTTGSTLVFYDMAFPEEPSPFKDIRVRQAVSLAIDRKTICEKVLFGGSEPWGEILCPYNYGFDPNIKPDPYDPEKAKAMLAEAGYPKGFNTDINTTAASKYWWEAIAANLADIGIIAKINIFEGGAWYGAHKGKKLHGLGSGGLWYDAEPHPGADIQNSFDDDRIWSYVKMPEASQAIRDSMAATSVKEATEWGRKLSRIIRKDVERPVLWANHANYGLGPKIVKWEPQLGSYPGSRFEHIKIK